MKIKTSIVKTILTVLAMAIVAGGSQIAAYSMPCSQISAGGSTMSPAGKMFLTGALGVTPAGTVTAEKMTLHQGFIAQLNGLGGSCCSVAGDANTDYNTNIGDAVFLINYVFKGGPAPSCPAAADANADCSLNVGDSVFLINFIFKGGPSPACGCVE